MFFLLKFCFGNAWIYSNITKVNIQIVLSSHRFLFSKSSIIFFLKQESFINQFCSMPVHLLLYIITFLLNVISYRDGEKSF